ncbi:hypothetical protein ScPMuIL_013755 [Solemya velum]
MWTSSRTVRTYRSDGSGQPQVQTRTYNYGGGEDGGTEENGGFGAGFGGGFGDFGSHFKSGLKKFFGGGGGGGAQIRISGGGGDDHGGRFSFTQRPTVVGRPTRKEKKNPFSGVVNQNYDDVKKACLAENSLFEDPEFKAEDMSIFFSRAPPRPFEWKRPHEICDNPQFISQGASRFDVQQGELGDCWLLAAVASLTCNERLLAKVVPQEQNFEEDYCGLFRFHFWHQGDWVEVIVDDRLPTYMGELVFMHSTEKNEFWSALMEKAYAKLEGSYESLKGGSTSEAMEDFTGGVTEMFDLRKAPPNMLQIMIKASQRESLMGCSIDADPNQLEAQLANGLVMGHAYSVTAVKMMNIQTPRMSGAIPMVRVRNPWGNEAEWKGPWSDQSEEWNFIPQETREEVGLTFDDDGEFWMSFKDWSNNFEKLEICNLSPDALDEGDDPSGKKRWETKSESGEWIPRVNAGGCRNYLETFWTNPQYRVTLTDPDDDDDEDKCTLLVGVLQKDRRKKRKEGLDLLTIGYVIYRLKEENTGPLDMNFFKYNASCAKAPSFINMREICGRHKLEPGTYAIIPSTFEPAQKGDFLIRLFSEKASVAGEIDEETGYIDQDVPEPTAAEQEQEVALKQKFRNLAGEDMEIDAYELQDILNAVFTREFQFDGFSIDTSRSMIAMHDGDLSGKLGYEEFKTLWSDLRKWKKVFKEFDHDNSGKLNSYELRSALHGSGFRLSNRTLSALVMRYSDKEGQIAFGDFVLCAIRLKTMLSSFANMDPERQGAAVFDIDTFVQTTMYS